MEQKARGGASLHSLSPDSQLPLPSGAPGCLAFVLGLNDTTSFLVLSLLMADHGPSHHCNSVSPFL